MSFFVGKPLWWALGQAGLVSDEEPSSSNSWWVEYAVVGLLERAADAVLSHHKANYRGPGDALYSMESFRREFSSCVGKGNDSLGEVDLKLLLRYMERDKRFIITDKDVRSALSTFSSCAHM